MCYITNLVSNIINMTVRHMRANVFGGDCGPSYPEYYKGPLISRKYPESM